MTEGYLQIMLESLEKKLGVLNQILSLEKEQLEIALQENVDMERYDETVDRKGELVDELNRLDEGFTNTYELVKDEVQSHPDKYREIVLKMQDAIREAVDLSVEVQAQETRNKDAISLAISRKRKDLKEKHVNTNAALKYYKSMSRMNTVDPQLMDRKK